MDDEKKKTAAVAFAGVAGTIAGVAILGPLAAVPAVGYGAFKYVQGKNNKKGPGQ